MIEVFQPELNTEGLRIGIVKSRFNPEIGNVLFDACVKELLKQGVAEEDILYITVPGALEIPLALQMLAKSEEFDALIALGAVVRGETYHFELVANESGKGVSEVSLAYTLPIANAILTTENDEQALARAETKGKEAALVAIEMSCLYEGLDQFIGISEPLIEEEEGEEEDESVEKH